MADDTDTPQNISEPREAFRCPFMSITHQRAEFPGFTKDYYVVRFGRRGGVVVLRDDRVLLVKQFRFLLGGYSWELPGGTIDAREDLEAGLIRECLEETGVRPRELTKLVEYYPGLDNVDNRTTIFLSQNAEVAAPFRSALSEVVAIDWVSIDRCVGMALNGEILDAMTVAGMLAFDVRRRRHQI